MSVLPQSPARRRIKSRHLEQARPVARASLWLVIIVVCALVWAIAIRWLWGI